MAFLGDLFNSAKNKAASSDGSKGEDDAQKSSPRSEQRRARREALARLVDNASRRFALADSISKRKVLSLDKEGHEFIVLLELPRMHHEDASQATNLQDLQLFLLSEARKLEGTHLRAVYWTYSTHTSTVLQAQRAQHEHAHEQAHLQAHESQPPASLPPTRPAPLVAQPGTQADLLLSSNNSLPPLPKSEQRSFDATAIFSRADLAAATAAAALADAAAVAKYQADTLDDIAMEDFPILGGDFGHTSKPPLF